LGAIGYDNEVNCPAVGGPRLGRPAPLGAIGGNRSWLMTS
jgi:hypothetical protein